MYRYIVITLLFCFSCTPESTEKHQGLFELKDSSFSGIDFSNNLNYDRDFNIYTYRNFYNGGGVAIGDINNDGLSDLYFTSNMSVNKLYLNQGDFKFKDVSVVSGTEGSKSWSTGVAMVDINADGWLDIYVCNSGDVEGDDKENELFINQKDGTFKEAAKEFGLADKGYSTHAAFFDMDKDGDLDMYLLNNSYRAIGSFNPNENIRNVRDDDGGDKLFVNDKGLFKDVSIEAGIYGSEIGFGLGVTIGDVDQDGWDDIYVCNDFFEKDYLYMNNGDGTFKENLEEQMKSISVASMGADMADVNNDGYADLFVTEMLPGDERRIKTKTTFEDWDKYQSNLKNGYYHQFTRNMLHINNGDGSFSEVGRYANVEATDWSWGALIADFNNDSKRDIFVANGINKDLTDQDFINFLSSATTMREMTKGNKVNYKELIDVIPSERIPNHMFLNQDFINFKDVTKEYGMDQISHSNGSAYGDLDNDGDLDLVVNNVNMPAFVYENKLGGNFVQFTFEGYGQNAKAIGTKLYLYSDSLTLYDQFMPTKGFQSSMQYVMHFGLENKTKIDSIRIVWPNNKSVVINEVPINKRTNIAYNSSAENYNLVHSDKQIFKKEQDLRGLEFAHKENTFVDFDRDRLLYHMVSTEGPKMEVADLNGDNRDDLVICGAKDQASAIYIKGSGSFRSTNQKILSEFSKSEDQDVAIGDLDGDGDKDIYIASGGNEFSNQNIEIKDKILLNDGRGNFENSSLRISPKSFIHTAAIELTDVDGDKDLDVLQAERIKTFQYGVPCDGFVLEQNKDIQFNVMEGSNVLKGKGMYTDIKAIDIDDDGQKEIVTCGHYQNISIYKMLDGKWQDKTSDLGLLNTEGWWNTLNIVDIDNDGDQDIIAGNHGLNSRFKASQEEPLCLHVNDFDKNGSVEQLLCSFQNGVSYPFALRHDLIKQLPYLKKRLLKYEDYALKTIEEIFTEAEFKNTLTLEAKVLSSCIFINEGTHFTKKELPKECQYAPIYAILSKDLNADGNVDVLLGGNLYEAKPEIGRYDATRGIFLKGIGGGQLEFVSNKKSGFTVDGQIRDLKSINIDNKDYILVSRNNDSLVLFSY